jgi:hypothetical protein
MSQLPAGTAGAATVLITGTRGKAGYAMAWSRPRRRQPSRPSQPSPVIGMARCMLGCRHTVSRTYGPAATKAAPASASGWGSAHGRELNSEQSLAR